MLYKFNVEGHTISEVRENARTVARDAFTNGSFGIASHVIALLEIDVEVTVYENPDGKKCHMSNLDARCVAGERTEVCDYAHRHNYDPELLS